MANLQPQYELYCFQKLSCMQYAFRQRPGFDCRIRQKRLKPPLLTQRLIGSVVEHCPAILFLPTVIVVVVVVVVVDRREKRNIYFFYSPPPGFLLADDEHQSCQKTEMSSRKQQSKSRSLERTIGYATIINR